MFSSAVRLVLLTTAICGFSLNASSASKHFLKVLFVVKDDSTKTILNQVVLSVSNADGAAYSHYAKDGKTEVQFELGEFVYDVKVERAGYVPKTLRFDTRNIPDEDKTGGFSAVIDISLFRFVQGFDLEVMQAPCGINKYDATAHDLLWDFAQAQQRVEEIKREFERLQSSTLKASFEKFDEAYFAGAKHFEQKAWLSALVAFQKAGELLPGEPMSTEKVKTCKAALDEQIAAHALANRQQELIELGNEAMLSKCYDVAKNAYRTASQLNPTNKLPKERLFEIQELEKNLARTKP